MKQKLDELIRLVTEEKVVEKLVLADSYEERLAIYQSEKEKLSDLLDHFKESATELIRENDYAIIDYDIFTQNAIEFCLICIMTNIDDCDMISNFTWLPHALRKVEGITTKTARRLANHVERYNLKGGSSEEELVDKFFG